MILNNLRDDYPTLIRAVHQNGEPVSPEAALSYEWRDVPLVLHDPVDALPLGIGMKLDLATAAIESLELISGKTYSDDVYLARNNEQAQIARIYGALFSDAETRHAAVDNTLHFLFRHARLELHVHQADSDVCDRLPYDIFRYTQLQLTMANLLGVAPGEYHHHVTALYLKAGNVGILDRLHATTEYVRPADYPRGFGREARTWDEVANRAGFVLDVAAGRIIEGVNPNGFSPAERWYLEALRPYWTPQEGQ